MPYYIVQLDKSYGILGKFLYESIDSIPTVLNCFQENMIAIWKVRYKKANSQSQ